LRVFELRVRQFLGVFRVAVVRDDARERNALLPAGAFKFGRRAEAIDEAEAEVGDRLDVRGNFEDFAQPCGVEDADPADAD
jgi:hypothetical protein